MWPKRIQRVGVALDLELVEAGSAHTAAARARATRAQPGEVVRDVEQRVCRLGSGRAPGEEWWGAEGRWAEYPSPTHELYVRRESSECTHLSIPTLQVRAPTSHSLPKP